MLTHAGVTKSPQSFLLLPEASRHEPEGLGDESPGAGGHEGQASHPTPQADRLQTKAQSTAGSPCFSPGVYLFTCSWAYPSIPVGPQQEEGEGHTFQNSLLMKRENEREREMSPLPLIPPFAAAA